MPKAPKVPAAVEAAPAPAPAQQRSTNEILLVIVQALANVHSPNSVQALREIEEQLTPEPAE